MVQESPRSVQKGYVKATFLEPDEAHDYTDQTLISLGEEVEHLLSSGVRLNDIAILVRKNKSIPVSRTTSTKSYIIKLYQTKPSASMPLLPSA